MDETNLEIFMRSPHDFSDWVFEEKSHRSLKKKVDDGNYETGFEDHIPETVTLEEFRSELDKIGRVTRFETYVDFDSVFTVTRGSIIKEGIEHFFHIMYPYNKLYKGYMTGALSTILYTKTVEDPDG